MRESAERGLNAKQARLRGRESGSNGLVLEKNLLSFRRVYFQFKFATGVGADERM
jgi:hypothetical protein